MGELTQCNYCSFQNIKRTAARNGERITTKPGKRYKTLPKGVNVFSIPRGEKLDEEKHLVSWFWALPHSCSC
jgi:hypothetical protein